LAVEGLLPLEELDVAGTLAKINSEAAKAAACAQIGVPKLPGIPDIPTMVEAWIVGNWEGLKIQIRDECDKYLTKFETDTNARVVGEINKFVKILNDIVKKLNKLLKGVENSQHIYGYAADIVLTNGIETSTLFNWCRFNLPQYHQLIWEYPERGLSYIRENGEVKVNSWVHIAYVTGNHKKTISLASEKESYHESYAEDWTYRKGKYTHDMVKAQFTNEVVPIPTQWGPQGTGQYPTTGL